LALQAHLLIENLTQVYNMKKCLKEHPIYSDSHTNEVAHVLEYQGGNRSQVIRTQVKHLRHII
jgi:hypothetical protein